MLLKWTKAKLWVPTIGIYVVVWGQNISITRIIYHWELMNWNRNLCPLSISQSRPAISDADPAWYTFISKKNQNIIEAVQQRAAKNIHPDLSYEDRLAILSLWHVDDFLYHQCLNHFHRIVGNPNHTLHHQVTSALQAHPQKPNTLWTIIAKFKSSPFNNMIFFSNDFRK